uniref:Negatively light-regulated protein n=1 Tax=Oryza punctata TaxID=4537 RepID=A0A0E0MLY7_ORYPU
MADCNGKSSASSMEKETYAENKYGGITPKKPLISKDHERAYFDSADWVLGKQAANGSARAAIESLKPKLKVSKNAPSPVAPSQADLCIQLISASKVKLECSLASKSQGMEDGNSNIKLAG